MDLLHVLSGLLNNPAVVGLSGLLLGSVGAPLVVAVTNALNLKALLIKDADQAGYCVGQLVTSGLDKIKDPTLLANAIDAIKTTPDVFDKGFDRAIDEYVAKRNAK